MGREHFLQVRFAYLTAALLRGSPALCSYVRPTLLLKQELFEVFKLHPVIVSRYATFHSIVRTSLYVLYPIEKAGGLLLLHRAGKQSFGDSMTTLSAKKSSTSSIV
jgi:hypothetical protein